MARSPFPKRRWLLPLLQGGLLLMLGIGLWALLTQPPHLRRTGPAQSVQEPTLHPADATKVFPLTRLAATKTARLMSLNDRRGGKPTILPSH
jgi:hypothetical protein